MRQNGGQRHLLPTVHARIARQVRRARDSRARLSTQGAPFWTAASANGRDLLSSAHFFNEDNIMTFSMYDASVPVFKQILGSLSALIDKAEAHAEAKKIEPQVLLQVRLYPDMFPFIRQVQVACDFAKGCAARLAGAEVPRHEDTEQSFGDLKARIAKVIAFIDTLSQDDIAASAQRDITTSSGANAKQFKGQVYLLHYAMPHFYFHATTAYDLLRHNGVEVGKKDFVGSF